jgi:hypothetical protein
VTLPQIETLGLPTAPPKATDRRAFVGDTVQLEAIAPDELSQILLDAVEQRIVRAAFDRVRRAKRGDWTCSTCTRTAALC